MTAPEEESCAFCEIVWKRAPALVVHETGTVLAFLDNAPLTPGHTLIVPTGHRAKVEDLGPDRVKSLFGAVHRLVRPISNAVGATASTILISNGYDAGQRVPHVHVHIIPRYGPSLRRKPSRVADLLPPAPRGKPQLAETAEHIRSCIAQGASPS